MRKGSTAILLLALTTVSSAAPAAPWFNARLEKGHALLHSGDVEGALAQYHDLQTENPESEVLYYNIGRAQYEQGLQRVEAKTARDAVLSFEDAKTSFEKVLLARDPEIRKDAAYNHANCVAQIAKASASAQDYQKTLDSFKQSIAEYEQFLREHPGHEGARGNLDHMRYLLKSMMQNPPPPQQSQDQQQQQGNERKDDQNKQQGQEQQGQEKQQAGDPNKQEQQKEGQEKKDQEKQAQEQKDQQREKKQMAEAQKDASKDQQDHQQKSIEDGQKDAQSNVEAILQSLEDVDKREQRETKNVRTDVRISAEWW